MNVDAVVGKILRFVVCRLGKAEFALVNWRLHMPSHPRRGNPEGTSILAEFNRLKKSAFAAAMVCPMLWSASALANTLSYQSTPGDWIGQGQSLTFNEGVTATASTDKSFIGVAVNTPEHWLYLDLAAPEGQELIPGVYEGAVRYPFQEPWQPGLSFSGDGRGCNRLTGTFTINSVRIGGYGYVEELDATWVQNCEGFMPPLYGQVTIANPPPPPALEFDLTASTSGSVTKLTGVALIGGTVQCSTNTTAQISYSLSQRVGRKAMASGSGSVIVPCGPTASTWTSNVASQSGVPFGQGQAQLDLNGSAFDPTYGGMQTQTASTVVNLSTVKRAVKSAKGKIVRD